MEAGIADFNDPALIHRARAGAGFAANNDPIDPGEIKVRQRAEQRLNRQKLYFRRGVSEPSDPAKPVIVFHSDAHPHIPGPRELRSNLAQTICSLGENLISVSRRVSHDLEDTAYKAVRHSLMKQIAHGIDENHARFRPFQWQLQHVEVCPHSKSVTVVALSHRLKAFGHTLRIAIEAAGRNF